LWRIGYRVGPLTVASPAKKGTASPLIKKNRLTLAQAMFGQCLIEFGSSREPSRHALSGNLGAMLAGDVMRRNQN
jgi:hypothetical protein